MQHCCYRQRQSQNIDIGFVADLEIKKLLTEKQVNEKTVLAFTTESKDFLCTFVYKIQAKSPLANRLVGSLSLLDSFQICSDQERCIGKFRRALNILHSCNRVDINDCNGIHRDYMAFIQEAKYLSEYKEFRKSEDRVDRLF